jgi:predicted RNase H-like HicB family nuclease
MNKEFTIIIEQDEDGIYVASVPELEGCHTQAENLDILKERIKEAIELYLEIESDFINEIPLEFVGIQKIKVAV